MIKRSKGKVPDDRSLVFLFHRNGAFYKIKRNNINLFIILE